MDRRLAAIVVADIVGYSHLMGAYIDDTYPFMLSHERERFIGALRSVALLNE